MDKPILPITAKSIALYITLVLISLPFGCRSPAPLKVGTLPVLDSLPLSLARHKPIFAENKLAVEAVYFENPTELRAALMEGKVDAAITDLIGALLLNEGQEGGKIVRVALRASPGDGSLMLRQTVVVFNQRMVDTKPALIRRFLRAYEQAVRELNIRPEQYRSLVVGLLRIPPEVSASLPIPVFPFPGEVPTESDVESANAWLLENKTVSQPIPYSRAVNAGFLWDPYQFRPAACCGW